MSLRGTYANGQILMIPSKKKPPQEAAGRRTERTFLSTFLSSSASGLGVWLGTYQSRLAPKISSVCSFRRTK